MTFVVGTKGDDTVHGSADIDQLFGMAGNDVLKGFGGADYIDGGAGIDTVFYGDSLVGVTVNLMTGRGAGGTAELDTLVNVENVYASAYSDLLIGNDVDNELHGLSDGDTLTGGGGSDRLFGDDGNDALYGGIGDDSLFGGDGVDFFYGDAGADFLSGGAGVDFVQYGDSAVGVFVSLITNTGAFGDAQGDTFDSIESVGGSNFADNLWGDDGDNALGGNGGADSLKGFGGSDFLYGAEGDDSLWGMKGADFLFGGEGTDTLEGGDGDDYLDGEAGADVVRGGAGNDSYVVETVGDAVLEAAGEGTADVVYARTTYVLTAGAEIETLQTFYPIGNDAMDLVGNELSQAIVGNDGNNTLVGSPDTDGGGYDGLDVMTGNGGGDVFVWTSTAESGVAASEADVITDFNRLQGDLIAVNQIDANILVGGNQAFTFVGTGPFTGAGQISYFTTATDTFILLNTDGDATQEMTIRLAGVHNVDASWFVL